MGMTEQQQLHSAYLQREFSTQLSKKYEAGAEEHQSFVGDVPINALFQHALDEVLDQWVYIMTLRDKHAQITQQYYDRQVELEQKNAVLRQELASFDSTSARQGVEAFATAPALSAPVSQPLPRSSFVISPDRKMRVAPGPVDPPVQSELQSAVEGDTE